MIAAIQLLTRQKQLLENNIALYIKRMDNTKDNDWHLSNYQQKVYAEIELTHIKEALTILSASKPK